MCPLKKDVNNMTNLDKMRTIELSFYHWLQREYKPGYFENQ